MFEVIYRDGTTERIEADECENYTNSFVFINRRPVTGNGNESLTYRDNNGLKYVRNKIHMIPVDLVRSVKEVV